MIHVANKCLVTKSKYIEKYMYIICYNGKIKYKWVFVNKKTQK